MFFFSVGADSAPDMMEPGLVDPGLARRNGESASTESGSCETLLNSLEEASQSKNLGAVSKAAREFVKSSKSLRATDARRVEVLETAGRYCLSVKLFKDSEQYLTQALELRRAWPVDRHKPLELSDLLGDLAASELGLLNYQSAEIHAQECLNIRRVTIENGDTKIAQALELLVLSQFGSGRLTELELLAKELITVKKKNKDVTSLNAVILTLIRALVAQDKVTEAEEFLQTVSLTGNPSARLVSEYITLASVQVSMGHYEKAHPLLVTAGELLKKAPVESGAASMWSSLGAAFVWPGVDDNQAVQCYQKAAALFRQEQEETGSLTECLMQLHKLYVRLNDLAGLQSVQREIDAICDRQAGSKPLAVEPSGLYLRLAEDLSQANARVLLDQWLPLHENRFASPLLKALLKRVRGDQSLRLCQFAQAIACYEECIALLKKAGINTEFLRAECSRRISDCYFRTGNDAQALEWAHRASEAARGVPKISLADSGYRATLSRALSVNGQVQLAGELAGRDCIEFKSRKPVPLSVVNVMHDRASLLLSSGDIAGASREAAEMYCYSLRLPAPSPQVFSLLVDLALTQHKLTACADFASRALKATSGELVLSDGGKRLAADKKAQLLVHIGEFEARSGHFEEAQRDFQQCKELIDGDPVLKKSLLAVIVRERLAETSSQLQKGGKEAAVLQARDAMMVAERNFGRQSRHWVRCAGLCARKLLRAGYINAGVKMNEEYLQRTHARVGDSGAYLECLQQVADGCQLSNDFARAEELYTKAIELAQSSKSRQPLQEARALTGRAQVRIKRGAFSLANTDLVRALMIRKEVYPPGDASVIANLEDLVMCAEKLNCGKQRFQPQLDFQRKKRHPALEYLLSATYMNLAN